MTAESIARELGGRKSGAEWMAKCPAHDDHDPSLSVTEKNGKLLVKCRAGCPQANVIAALKTKGLWPERERREYPPEWGALVKTYDYCDEQGILLYQVCRFQPKNFRPRYPDGRGGWIYRKHPRQVLYHLREVLESPIVFVVEGEKDAETLREHGFVATTAAGGCNAPWLSEFTTALAGREVNLIPDNDKPGWDRVKVIARALLGHAARIRVCDLPRNTKDVSDWFAAGHSECELIAMLEGVSVH